MFSRAPCWLAIAVIVSVAPSPAEAGESMDDPMAGLMMIDAAMIGALSAVDIGGVVATTGLSISIAARERPGTGWLVAGGAFGTAQVLGGSLALYVGPSRTAKWLGGFTLAGGLTNIGLAIAGTYFPPPEDDDPEVRLLPLAMVDVEGTLAPGLGLSVVGF